MPIYEYVCRSCGEQLEQLQRLSDDALTDCPACGESALKRKVSAAGFRLSGGGWYETDFKSDRKRNLAGAEDKSSSAESNNGDGKSSEGSAKTESKDSGGSAKADKSGASKSEKTGQGDNKSDKKKPSGSSRSAD